jgi:hypothetical protein
VARLVQPPPRRASLGARRHNSDGWRVVDDYNQAVGKLQLESMMSIVASLFPQLETKVYRSGEEQTND